MMAPSSNHPHLFTTPIDAMPHATSETRRTSYHSPHFLDLPIEIIQHIFFDLQTVQSIHALCLTSRRLHSAYNSSQKLLIAERVLETQYGPLYDATQLVTLNSTESIHLPRKPAFSLALAKQIVDRGHVLNRWVALYPLLLWRSAPTFRRTLSPAEAYRLRRALYRFWQYNSACADETRVDGFAMNAFVRNSYFGSMGTNELRELEEVVGVLEEMLRFDCCPSDSTIQRHYSSLSPTRDLLDFGKYRKLASGSKGGIREVLANESWGDNISVSSHVSHLLQMTPDHLLHFREECQSKKERQVYIEELEPWTYGQVGIYEYASELRYDLGNALSHRNDGDRRGGGVFWITWDPEKQDGLEEEWIEDVISEKMAHLLRDDFVVCLR